MVPVRDLLGFSNIPIDRTAAGIWFDRNGITKHWVSGNGGKAEAVKLTDLPAEIRRAYLSKQVKEAGLDVGAYDDAAHIELMKAPVTAQDRGYDNAVKLMFIANRECVGMKWVDIEKAGKAAFDTFPTLNTRNNWQDKTSGVDPANWGPALAPSWSAGKTGDPISAEAWARLVNYMLLGGNNGTGFPLKHAYRMVEDDAKVAGWDWPKLHTIRRAWNKMDPVKRLVAEIGEERAKAVLRQTQPQHMRGIAAMDYVDFDGREFKVQVLWPDGTVDTPWVVGFVDRASRKIVGYAVDRSENIDVTEAAIINMCETHYRPKVTASDNGAAFTSRHIMGGQRPFYRKNQTKIEDWDVPGVLQILGIEARNKGIAAKTSNLQENVWSHLRHVDNHPAFHKSQRSGPNDPENRNSSAVPLNVFKQVLDKAINNLNSDTENEVKGLFKGESREQAFERLIGTGAKRTVTPLMRRRLSMSWKLKTVQADGRIRFQGGLFGDHTTQIQMLQYASKKVLVGFNSKNFNEPAMVCHWADPKTRGRLFLEALPAVIETQHASAEGLRAANVEKRRSNNIIQKAKVLNPDADVTAIREALVRDARLERPRISPTEQVVELETNSGFSEVDGIEEREKSPVSYLTEERLKNLDADTNRLLAKRS